MKKTAVFLMFALYIICIHSKSVKYIALQPDLTQYYRYANGGLDGNWYVGYNSCWIVKLPPISTKGYEKAFIGTKLGRAKTYSLSHKPWIKVPFEGKFFMALSQNPQFFSKNTYLLLNNTDIPLETPQNDGLLRVESSKWFWVEVPPKKISSKNYNYLALWSESNNFTNKSISPIIAGAAVSGIKISAWVNRSIKGTPPRNGNALQTPLNGITPAMAVKLVPKNNRDVKIEEFKIKKYKDKFIVKFLVKGTNIDRAWIEISYDDTVWEKYSHFIFNPPYSVTFLKNELPDGVFYMRAAASDTFENKGYSRSIELTANGI
jgi:hypothetical protein